MTTTLTEKLTEAEAALTRVAQDAEFQRLRAVDLERKKWEAREARMLRQIDELEKRAAVGEPRSRNEVAALPTISDLGERAGSGMGTGPSSLCRETPQLVTWKWSWLTLPLSPHSRTCLYLSQGGV